MPKNDQYLIEVYRSVVDYHNSLVNMRFTVAGLYLAGSAFLVNALFSNHTWCYTKITVCSLGIVLTVIVFIIEIRTKQLLENLGKFGGRIEEDFKVEKNIKVYCTWFKVKGFFALMDDQPIQPPVPFAKSVISHTKGLFCLYSVFLLFWVAMWILYAKGFTLFQNLI